MVYVLTEYRYINPVKLSPYVANVLHEDELLVQAIRNHGMPVERKAWDDPSVDWSVPKALVFRTTWNYFSEFPKFEAWLNQLPSGIQLINSENLIRWNMHKTYLKDLEISGVNIPETIFINDHPPKTLRQWFKETNWKEMVLKPVVSGAARLTFRISQESADAHEATFNETSGKEAMMIQEFQPSILSQGEVSAVVIGGQFTHAVLKLGKPGDFRVQDDFGGSVHPYSPSQEEIEYVEQTLKACPEAPAYARVDYFWDSFGDRLLGELELIEPELWFRQEPQAAQKLAGVILGRM